jgi:protein gp37
MGKTKISWTQTTWNPVVGCSRVSDGCRHCYAERMDKRIRAAHDQEFREWSAPNAAYNVRLHPERLEQPLHWKKPRMVFVNSMSDLFHDAIPAIFITRVFAVMASTPEHTYQILTKRQYRLEALLNEEQFQDDIENIMGEYTHADFVYPLPNVWLGVSVENQRAADERIPLLLQTPAAIRFLSCEPLLESVDLSKWTGETRDFGSWSASQAQSSRSISWVICGGESGPNHREMNPDWARYIRDQCQAAGVAFWYKQNSGYRPQADTKLDGVEWHQFPEG